MYNTSHMDGAVPPGNGRRARPFDVELLVPPASHELYTFTGVVAEPPKQPVRGLKRAEAQELVAAIGCEERQRLSMYGVMLHAAEYDGELKLHRYCLLSVKTVAELYRHQVSGEFAYPFLAVPSLGVVVLGEGKAIKEPTKLPLWSFYVPDTLTTRKRLAEWRMQQLLSPPTLH